MLTEEQESTATYYDHSATIAIPGSGKTHTLISLATNLLTMNRKIVIVTFTREAASEIRHRLSRVPGYNPSLAIVGTLHSIAYKQLRASGISKTLISPEHQRVFQLRALYVKGISEKSLPDFQAYCDKQVSAISQPYHDDFNQAFRVYRDMVKQHNGFTLDDIISIATSSMLKAGANFFDAQHLLIDEVQDCDPTQIKWALSFSKTSGNPKLHLVGDDDQSIYGFRNSSGYDVFNQISSKLPVKQFILTENFRSHEEIVQAGANLIGYNSQRIIKLFSSHLGEGGTFRVETFGDKDSEIDAITSFINELPKPLAILCRNNSQAREISKALIANEIKHVIKRQDSLFESYEAQMLMSCLSLFLKSDLPTITNLLFSVGIPEAEIQASVSYNNGKIQPRMSKLSPSSRPILQSLIQLILKFRDPRYHKNPTQAIDAAFQWVCENAYRDEALSKVHGVLRDKFKGDLQSRISTAQQKAADQQSTVQIMTMHASKGKQFTSVIVPFAVDGNIPLRRAGEVTDHEEERRLMFVAITRAIKHMVITTHKSSGAQKKSPSPFITESLQEVTL